MRLLRALFQVTKWGFIGLLGLCLLFTLIDRLARWHVARPVRIFVVSPKQDLVRASVSAAWFKTSQWLEPVCSVDPLGTLDNDPFHGVLFRGLDTEHHGWRGWTLWLRVEGPSFPTFAGPAPADGIVQLGTHDVTGVVTVRGCEGPFEIEAMPPYAPFCNDGHHPVFRTSPVVKTRSEPDGSFVLPGLLHLPYRVSARTCRGDPEVQLAPDASSVAVVLD